MTLSIELWIVPAIGCSIGARRNTCQSTVVLNEVAKFVGVEPFVATKTIVLARSGSKFLADVVSARGDRYGGKIADTHSNSLSIPRFSGCP